MIPYSFYELQIIVHRQQHFVYFDLNVLTLVLVLPTQGVHFNLIIGLVLVGCGDATVGSIFHIFASQVRLRVR